MIYRMALHDRECPGCERRWIWRRREGEGEGLKKGERRGRRGIEERRYGGGEERGRRRGTEEGREGKGEGLKRGETGKERD